MAWNAKNKREGQHQGPITAAYQRVLHALLWHFMSYRDGLCFPSYGFLYAKVRNATSALMIVAVESIC